MAMSHFFIDGFVNMKSAILGYERPASRDETQEKFRDTAQEVLDGILNTKLSSKDAGLESLREMLSRPELVGHPIRLKAGKYTTVNRKDGKCRQHVSKPTENGNTLSVPEIAADGQIELIWLPEAKQWKISFSFHQMSQVVYSPDEWRRLYPDQAISYDAYIQALPSKIWKIMEQKLENQFRNARKYLYEGREPRVADISVRRQIHERLVTKIWQIWRAELEEKRKPGGELEKKFGSQRAEQLVQQLLSSYKKETSFYLEVFARMDPNQDKLVVTSAERMGGEWIDVQAPHIPPITQSVQYEYDQRMNRGELNMIDDFMTKVGRIAKSSPFYK